MKTKEGLDALKEEVESVNEKLHELTPEELEQVTGGLVSGGPEPVAIEYAAFIPKIDNFE